jgi:hemerythrin
MYTFKDEYKTGIESIDNEHRKLFEIADRAYVVMVDEFIPDKYDYIVDILKELKDYAATHFKNEEDYMVSIGYKKLFTQKIEHNAFIEKVEQYDLETVDENQREVIMELLDYLGNWLVDHILESDKQIGK